MDVTCSIEWIKRYLVIAIDAYRPPYIPWHLTTVEFFSEARSLN